MDAGMRHPSPAARANQTNPAANGGSDGSRGCSPTGASRSTVMAAATTAITRKSMTPRTSTGFMRRR